MIGKEIEKEIGKKIEKKSEFSVKKSLELDFFYRLFRDFFRRSRACNRWRSGHNTVGEGRGCSWRSQKYFDKNPSKKSGEKSGPEVHLKDFVHGGLPTGDRVRLGVCTTITGAPI